MNKLILGDNLEVLRHMPSESVDLNYLDPPFFSNRHYECIWGDKGEIRSFEDRWSGGIEHYIAWLKERVQEMHRILKPTGSIYLHCDWHADAYIRVYILDKVFGEGNFRNAIKWCYSGGGVPKNDFARKHDTIFRYSKSNVVTFNKQYRPYSESSRALVESRGGISIDGKVRDIERGAAMNDWWSDINSLQTWSSERVGYPTQKPELLMKRIIESSTNEGDVVLDPFVGGGTTIAVANKMGRNWIGIDQSATAIRVSESRVNNQNLLADPFEVILHKYDYENIFNMDPFKFESWIVEQCGGIPNEKQRGDKGLDGRATDGTPIQVKQSEGIGRNVIDNLKSAAERFDKVKFEERVAAGIPVAHLIAFSFGKGAIQEVARLKLEQGIVIDLVEVGTIVELAKAPTLKLDIQVGEDNVYTFTAEADSAAGIANYSWDWDYEEDSNIFKPEVQIDKTGRMEKKFTSGVYTIAVKAVDEDGLETILIHKFKVD